MSLENTTIAYALMACLLVFLALGWLMNFQLLRQMKARHRDAWLGLGSPSAFLNFDLGVQRTLGRFIWRSEYRALNDKAIDRSGKLLKIFAVSSMTFFMLGLIFALGTRTVGF